LVFFIRRRRILGCGAVVLGVAGYSPFTLIESRGMSAVYLPIVWLLFAAACALRDAAVNQRARRSVFVLLLAAVLVSQVTVADIQLPMFAGESEQIARVSAKLVPIAQRLMKGDTVVIAEDLFSPRFPWAIVFLLLNYAQIRHAHHA
jgi:hypothetical protein